MKRDRITIAYIRVSTDKQVEFGYGLKDQKYRIDNYMSLFFEGVDLSKIKYYVDDGYSAKTLERKAMNKIIEKIRAGKVERVVVHNLDRLTRSVADLSKLLNLFESFDVELVSIKERIETRTAMGRFFIYMIVLIAQWERETISERTIRAIDQSAREGKFLYGTPPFGYIKFDGRLTIHKENAEIVRRIFKMYLEDDLSSGMIAIVLNNENTNERVWKRNRIREILHNNIYIGTYINKRIVVENHSPAIVDREIFKKVQIKIAERTYHKNKLYKFNNLCYEKDEITKYYHESATNRYGTVYLYYKSRITRNRINENDLNEQITTHIDSWINELLLNKINKDVKKLRDKDNLIKLVTNMNRYGLLDDGFTYSLIKEIKKEKEITEENIEALKRRVVGWKYMTRVEQLKFLKNNVDKIIIDNESKRIIKVKFKNTKKNRINV